MLPSFDIQGGAMLVAARMISVVGLLSMFGTILFRVGVAPPAFALMHGELVAAIKRRLLLLAQASIAAALAGTGVWLVVQAANFADAGGLTEAFAAVPTVLLRTSFGHVVLLQLACLLGLAVITGWRDSLARQRIALVAALVAVALQAGHSHAFSMQPGPSLLLACDVLHLVGAGAWLGGLVPLLLVVVAAPPKAAATAARWFSPIGQASLVALVVSAAVQGWVLVGSIPGLVGTAYGWMVLFKMALFGVLFGFAWCNRYRFAPALLRADRAHARRVLIRSIVLQTLFAVAIIVAAVILSALPPAMHLQPLWPFPQRFSAAAVQEDADIRREVLGAALVAGGGIAMLVIAFLARRTRWLAAGALAGAALAFWLALPHFGVLLVDANPTSFFHAPTGFAAETIAAGRDIYAANCVSCHGATGGGDGELAKTLPIPPADLTAMHLWMHTDGQLFWWLTHGIENPEGGMAMPGFGATLDADQRWAVIDYIRAHNAGSAAHGGGTWPRPVQAPGFTATCDGHDTTLAALRGQYVRLLIGPAPPTAAGHAVACYSHDDTVAEAYAIVGGVGAGDIGGREFLIDGQGWLRAMQRAGTPGGWDNDKILAATIERLRASPVAPPDAAAPMDMSMPGIKM